MKKQLILLLLPLFSLGCMDSDSEMPEMEIVGIYITGDEEEINYVNQFDKLPDLQVGDEVQIVFELDGNGENLKSFNVVNDNTAIKTVLFFYGDEVSPELSELDKGWVVFVDGVEDTWITVKAQVIAPFTEEQLLSFYLFSNAPEGSSVGLSFRANNPAE